MKIFVLIDAGQRKLKKEHNIQSNQNNVNENNDFRLNVQ